jgi:glycosyltransferase involved in cell wall biosynthesis
VKKKIEFHKTSIKVCFFSPSSYPFFYKAPDVAYGGAELQMYLLAKYLSENTDFKICFFVGNYGQKKRGILGNIQVIKTICLKQNENIFFKFFKAIKYFFQIIKQKPDVLISTNANALTGISAYLVKLLKKNFIYRTSHVIDVNNDYIKDNGISGKIFSYGLQNAHLVITQNNEHKDLLKKNHDIDAELIRNSFEIKDVLSKKADIILWVGRFQKWKNPELFLKMSGHFPKKKFVMICPYEPPGKKEWEKLKSKAEKISNLKFIEKVPYNEIQEYFNNALLFVNTSDYEGFPNTFLQAAQGKTPIVSLNVNPDNFLNNYHCGIFADGNFEKMIRETAKLIENKEEMNKMADNLFQYLKENHDIEKNSKLFSLLIEKLVW